MKSSALKIFVVVNHKFERPRQIFILYLSCITVLFRNSELG